MTTLSEHDVHNLLTHRGFLDHTLKGYHRISLSEACQSLKGNNLAIWRQTNQQWAPLTKEDMESLVKQASLRDQSLCRTYFVDTLGLGEDEYTRAKWQLDEINPGSPVAVYKKDNQFVIVYER
jgi:hypothetical protein